MALSKKFLCIAGLKTGLNPIQECPLVKELDMYQSTGKSGPPLTHGGGVVVVTDEKCII